jgi:hypothetical protein
MEFQSIEQVRQQLGISATGPEEIKREVRNRLREVHPDALTGAGLPADSAKQEEVLRLTAALNFLNRPEIQGTLVPLEPMTELVKIVRDLVQVNQGQNSQTEEQEILRREKAEEQTLSRQSEARVQEVRSAGRLPVISLTAVSTLLTAIWILPTIVQRNLVLGNYVDVSSSFFAAVWLVSLCTTAATWVWFKWRAQGEALFQRTLNLESTQNMLFNSFLSDRVELSEQVEQLRALAAVDSYKGPDADEDYMSHYRISEFSNLSRRQRQERRDSVLESLGSNGLYLSLRRDNEFGFWDHEPAEIANDLEWLRRANVELKSRYSWDLSEFQKADFVSYVESKSAAVKQGVAERTKKWPLLWPFFFSKEPIDGALAQNLADLILTRAEAKGVVREIQSPSLDSRYAVGPWEE